MAVIQMLASAQQDPNIIALKHVNTQFIFSSPVNCSPPEESCLVLTEHGKKKKKKKKTVKFLVIFM